MKDSYKYIAGIDEVGRGTIAGPVVAAAVILRRDHSYDELDDSKRLTEKNRKLLSKKIISQSIAWSISLSDVNEIDNLNILWATMLAMRRSILGLPCKPDFIQIDGNTLPNLEFYNEVLSAEAVIIFGMGPVGIIRTMLSTSVSIIQTADGSIAFLS